MKAYRLCLSLFLRWCADQRVWPESLPEVDDLLVEWKNSGEAVSKSKFANAMSAVEMCIPFARGQLPWSKSFMAA